MHGRLVEKADALQRLMQVSVGRQPHCDAQRARSGATGGRRPEGTEKLRFSGVPWSGGLGAERTTHPPTRCSMLSQSFD